MRQLSKFGGRCRWQERRFLTEDHILKFANPRDRDDPTNLVFGKSNSPANKTLIEASTITEPWLGKAKAASA